MVESLANDEDDDQVDQNEEDQEDEEDQVQDKSNTAEDVSIIEKLDLMAANTEDYIDSLASNMTSKI